MFTGIIEATGIIKLVEQEANLLHLTIESTLSDSLQIDQSLAHDGICLTVTAIDGNTHTVTAIDETIQKTTISSWETGYRVNLERCMKLEGRLDGHIVQGHIDTTGICTHLKDADGVRVLEFQISESFAPLLIEKGSVCLNGIALTCFHVSRTGFEVAIIPYTWENTNLRFLKEGNEVNIEFDVIGKYINRIQSLQQS